MNDDEKSLLTICISICVLVGGIIFAGFQSGMLKAVSEPPKFQIVDKYNEHCDVVQYNHSGDARFHYFLDCSK